MKLLRFSCIVSLCLAAAASHVALSGATDHTPVPDGEVVAWTEKRVADWQPKASERRFDEIGWAKDIRTAKQLAQGSQRPVFVFTMDGRINLGRC